MGIAEPFYSMERAVLRRARRSGRAGAAPRIPAPSHQETDPREARGRSTDRSVERAPSPSPNPDRPAGLHFFFFFEIAAAAAPPPRPPIRPAVSRTARRKSRSEHTKCSLVQRWCHPIQNLFGACLLVRRIVWSERTNFGTRDAL